MKLRQCFGTAALALVAIASSLSASAQVVTYLGSSSGGTMPGSATDFIFFNNSTFPGSVSGTNTNTNPDSASSVLTSFSFIGGVNSDNGDDSYSTINTPAGTALQTGDIQANGSGFTPALAFEPGTAASYSTDGDFNSSFNYNDFDVYLMYSNTGDELTDTAVSFTPYSLTLGTDVGTPSVVSLDGITAPADTNTDTSTADYLEFNIAGLATALQTDNSIVFTVSATHDGTIAYIGAASFESLPEPSVWALLGCGIGALVITRRIRRTLRDA